MRKSILFIVVLFIIFSGKVLSQNFILSNSLTSSSLVRTAELKYLNDGLLIYGDFTGTLNVPGANVATGRDIFLAKYDENFELEWLQQIGGTLIDWSYDMVIHDNYVYIVGTYKGTCIFDGGTEELTAIGSNFDAFLAKYNLDGSFVWAKPYAYNEAIQYATAIDVDINDSLIIGGYYSDSITFENEKFISANGMFYSKADTSGSISWAKNIPSDNTKTKIQAINAFNDGYYFTGNVEGAATFDIGGITSNDASFSDVFLYKTETNGTGSWLRRTYGYGSADTKTGTIAGGESGSIYFTGLYGGDYIEVDENDLQKSSKTLINNGSLDAFIIKYNTTGDLIWHYNYGGAGEEWARDIEYRNGFLYLTGYFSDTLFLKNDTLVSSDPLDYDALLGMFDSDGNLLRAAHIEDSNDGTTSGIALDVDENNNAFWAGDFKAAQIDIGDSTFNKTGTQSVFISKYKPTFAAAYTKKQDVTCYSGNNGELIVTPYFGVPPFNYSWSHDGGLNDSTALNLIAGTYTVTVTDALDSLDVDLYIITEPDSIIFNPVITQVSTCSYNQNGAINLNVSGGNGSNTYQWIESDGGNGVIFANEDQTNLTIGTYSVTVIDSEFCTDDTVIYITGPDPVIFGSSNVTDDSGPDGSPNGAIDLILTGGSTIPANYGASWTGPAGFTAVVQDISSLIGGNYFVTITDENFCDFDSSFTVVNQDTLFAYISDSKDDCTGGGGDGTATVSYYTPNPTPVITYSWSTGSTDSTVTGLFPGKYYVTITESDSAWTSVDSVEIFDLGYTIAGNLSGTTDVDCKDDADGYISLTVTTPGQLPYSYNWSNGGSTQAISNLVAGTYSVTLTDDNACTLQISNYTITEPTFDLVASASIISEPLCNGDQNGEIRVDANGGNNAPYTYKWDDPGGQTTQIVENLGAGFYNVTVTDYKGCIATDNINVTQPNILTVSGLVGDLTCLGNNSGTIALTVSGGTPPDYYFWSTADGSGLVVVDKNQSGLSAGTYNVTVTDQNSCEATNSLIVTEPTEITITENSVTNVSCNGGNDGSIDVSVSGGTIATVYTYNWATSDGSGLVVDSEDQTALSAGTYNVTVTDDNSCTATTSITLTEPTAINIVETSVNNITCNGLTDGSIDITVSGGTAATVYTYNWATSDGSGLVDDSEDQTGLGAGTYNLTVTDDNLCTEITSISIIEPLAISISSENSTDATGETIADGTVTVIANGGTGTLSYTLNPGNVTNQTGTFTVLPNDYTVEVIDDNSCGPVVSNTITVGYPDAIIDISKSNKIKIFPNPTSDRLFIEIDSEFSNLRIEVLNISGQVLLNKELKFYGITKEEIDLSNYPKGVYFIRIYNNSFNYKDKILLQ